MKFLDRYLFYLKYFSKYPYKYILYMKFNSDRDILYVCLYMDDLLFRDNNISMIKDFRYSMKKNLEITNLSLMTYFLIIEVIHNNAGIFIS